MAPDIPQVFNISGMRLGTHYLDGGMYLPLDLYIRGTVTYRDIFQGTPRHMTTFCILYMAGGPPQMQYCPTGNTMN